MAESGPDQEASPSQVALPAQAQEPLPTPVLTPVSTPPSPPADAQKRFSEQRRTTEITLCASPVEPQGTSKLSKQPSSSSSEQTCKPESITRSDTSKTVSEVKPGWLERLNLWIEILNDRWVWEVLSCVLALACLICIVILLAVYEDHPLPELPDLISINSLIAVFTAIMKAAVMVPVASGVSQLKWLWFSEPRSLADMDDFDNASRGPWGSFLLMLTPRKHYLASFGAFIAVVVLAIDPFSQQILSFYPCYDVVDSLVARVPRANNFTEGGQLTTQFNAELYGPMQAAIYHTVLSDRTTDASTLVSFDCQTGNCTFPSADASGATFQTLGMCHSCWDISDQIHRNASYPGWYLPSGDGFSTTRIGYVNSIKEQPWTMLNTKCTIPSMSPMDDLVQFQVLMSRHDSNSSSSSSAQRTCGIGNGPSTYANNSAAGQGCIGPASAYMCSLYPCVRTYSAEIRAGVLREAVLSTAPLRKTNASDPNVVNSTTALTFSLATNKTLRDGAWHSCARSNTPSPLTPVATNAVNNTLLLPTNSSSTSTTTSPLHLQTEYTEPDCVWQLAYSPALAINRFVATLFDKTVISDSSTQFSATQGPLWLKNLYLDGAATLPTVDAFVSSLADAITATMRQPRVPSSSSSSSSSSARGSVIVAQTCVAVRWEWLSLPSSLVAMTAAFLIMTVVRCVRTGTFHGAWRSSSLAPFFHGIDARTKEGLGDVGRQSEMVDAAKGIKVKVVPRGPRGGRGGEQGLEVVTVVSRRGTFCTTASGSGGSV